MKHTPGPWKVSVCVDGIYAGRSCVVRGPNGEILGPRQLGYKQDDNLEANASLIAAAPELLELCTKLWAAIENGDTTTSVFFDFREEYRNVLANVKGEK